MAMLIRSTPKKSRKMLLSDACDTFATHASMVHNVTDIDCWAQNGSTHGHVFATFQHRFLTKKKKRKKE